jgi:hypothetical protein
MAEGARACDEGCKGERMGDVQGGWLRRPLVVSCSFLAVHGGFSQ